MSESVQAPDHDGDLEQADELDEQVDYDEGISLIESSQVSIATLPEDEKLLNSVTPRRSGLRPRTRDGPSCYKPSKRTSQDMMGVDYFSMRTAKRTKVGTGNKKRKTPPNSIPHSPMPEPKRLCTDSQNAKPDTTPGGLEQDRTKQPRIRYTRSGLGRLGFLNPDHRPP
jgi:hypothetical protein